MWLFFQSLIQLYFKELSSEIIHPKSATLLDYHTYDFKYYLESTGYLLTEFENCLSTEFEIASKPIKTFNINLIFVGQLMDTKHQHILI